MSVTRDAKALPGIFIFKEEVNKRIKHFQNTKLPLLSNAIGKAETTSCWYSMAQFDELVREMHYLNADGLRIYFGAYPDDALQFANQLSIIFVPTRTNPATGKNQDIVIDHETNFELRITASEVMKTGGDEHKNLDFTGMCPPNCGIHELAYPH